MKEITHQPWYCQAHARDEYGHKIPIFNDRGRKVGYEKVTAIVPGYVQVIK